MLKKISLSLIFFCSITFSSCKSDSSTPEPDVIIEICQNIFVGNINLDSQQEVDDFVSQGYCEITGDLYIGAQTAGETDISDISGLSQLESIGGDILFIVSPQITSLNGLENLTEIQGDLRILLKNVNDLTALSNITEINGTLSIAGNDVLTSLTGLENLTRVSTLNITFNSALVNTSALNNLTLSERLDISFNPALETVGSVNTLFIGSVNINSNANIRDLSFLDGVNRIEELVIRNNLRLESFNGLSNLETVTRTVFVENNESLTSLSGLSSLTSIGSSGNSSSTRLAILNNATLISLSGLEAVTDFTGGVLIENNGALDDLCDLQTILNSTNLGTVTIQSNLFNPIATDIANGTNCSL